jgi:hypothetical protein
MKIHLGWIRVTATAAILAGAGAPPSAAQYAPYRAMPQPVAAGAPAATAASSTSPTSPTPRVASQQPYWQQAAQQAQAPVYRMAQAPATTAAQYPQTSAAYVPTATAMPAYAPTSAYSPAPVAAQAAQTYPQTQQYAPSSAYAPTPGAYQPYPRVAYQQSEATNGSEAQAEAEMPAPVQPEAPMNGGASNGMNGHANHGYVQNGQSAPSYANGCNCSNNGYPSGSYYTGDQACGDGYGLNNYFDDGCGYESQWFGGVYYLFMERDRPSTRKLTVAAADPPPNPYWPQADTTVLVNSDHDFRSGVEVRFGSTFTIGDDCETCNTGCNSACGYNTGCNSCSSCCPPTLYAWEFAWWGLADDENDDTYIDQPTTGLYGMVNFAGLGYDRDGDGTIENPVNGYYGYALPITAASDMLAQRVRTNFQAQNLELNIIRFPVCGVSCGGCNTGCNTGCDPCGCDQQCSPLAFSMYGSAGLRYFRADDEFMYASEFNGGTQAAFDGWSYADDNELFYDIEVDNHLLGPQLGWTMNYCYCKWNFFMNSTFGVFGNHIEHNQRMYSGGGGTVYFYNATGGAGEEFDVDSDKDDIAFLGELRLGGSYDLSCHWRGVLAYRAVAITGVATSTDQIPSDFSNPYWVQIIDSDSSMIVHGVQTGFECRY